MSVASVLIPVGVLAVGAEVLPVDEPVRSEAGAGCFDVGGLLAGLPAAGHDERTGDGRSPCPVDVLGVREADAREILTGKDTPASPALTCRRTTAEGTQRAHQVAQARSAEPADAQAAEPANPVCACRSALACCAPRAEPTLAETTMVRKGSSVRVRCWAWEVPANWRRRHSEGTPGAHERFSQIAKQIFVPAEREPCEH